MEGRIVWVFLIVAAKVGGSKDNLFPSLGQKLPSVGESPIQNTIIVKARIR